MAATASIVLPVHDFALEPTLECGQTFSWQRKGPQRWQGWIDGQPVEAWQTAGRLSIQGRVTRAAVQEYFQLNAPLNDWLAQLPRDAHLPIAFAFAPGLRILRQDPWETTASFICSSLKQIVQIQQINQSLRQRFGMEMAPGRFTFPDFSILASGTEQALRDCKLGYRARHLHRAALQLQQGEISLAEIARRPTAEARQDLMKLQGVGEKVANCILLFAYGRLEAFPIDVWVERVLRELYFPGKRRVTSQRLRQFAADYFGPYAGYAQQYLFHWIRNRPKV
jgi:N-glycosylase/DNA lyase